MSVIGSLPNLQVLKLKYQSSGGSWEIADEEFPELRYLLIEYLGLQHQHWETESSHFPRPSVFNGDSIPTLELIEVDPYNNSLVESAKKVVENQHNYGNYDLRVRVS